MRRFAAVSVAVIAILASGAVVLARSDGGERVTQNRRATSEYLVLRKHFITASAHYGRAARAGMAAVVRQTRASCKNVLAKAPPETPPKGRVSAADSLMIEALVALEVAQRRARRPAVEAFAAGLLKLTWSNGRVTALAHALAKFELATAQRPTLNVCPEMRAWVASGYTRLPAAVEEQRYLEDRRERRLSKAFGLILMTPGEAMLGVLRRYRPLEAGLTVRSLRKVEGAWRDKESKQSTRYWFELASVVGVPDSLLTFYP